MPRTPDQRRRGQPNVNVRSPVARAHTPVPSSKHLNGSPAATQEVLGKMVDDYSTREGFQHGEIEKMVWLARARARGATSAF